LVRQLKPALALAVLLMTSSAGTVWAAIAPADMPAANMESEQTNFENFLREFRSTAQNVGISPDLYDRATTGISFNPRVEELNEKQPEFVRPIWEYLAGAITPQRIERGRELIGEHFGLFQRLRDRFGVAPQILTAIWGIETGYGRTLGSFNLFEALANLAFEGPRTDFGKRELLAILEIAQQQRLDPAQMTGSWAGAFGQTQFIPTTFLKYAVDGDGDGQIDLWNSPADALASTANYLQQSGWQPEQIWGEEVQLPGEFAYANANLAIRKPVSEWEQLGVRAIPGQQLPAGNELASVILPAGYRGPAFLVLSNFNVLLKYNSAIPYALAVGLLADRIKGSAGVRVSWPTDEALLDQSSAIALQEGLTALGFPTGGADGVLGQRTAQAIRAYQLSRGLPADGYPTESLLLRILNERSAMDTGSLQTSLPSQ
jgi:membrane-bound lytic murein transglycosylase B